MFPKQGPSSGLNLSDYLIREKGDSTCPNPENRSVTLVPLESDEPIRYMRLPPKQAFEQYKSAETKALEILREMEGTGAASTDIELALLVAIFELHKKTVPSQTIGNIIRGHLKTLEPYYSGLDPADN